VLLIPPRKAKDGAETRRPKHKRGLSGNHLPGGSIGSKIMEMVTQLYHEVQKKLPKKSTITKRTEEE